MTAPAAITVAGLALPLVDTAGGPRLRPGGELDGLAAVVNGHLNGVLPELRPRLVDGEPAVGAGVFAGPPPSGLDLDAATGTWRRLTGRDPGADLVMVSSQESAAMVLPRQALLEILERMVELAAAPRERPAVGPPPEPRAAVAAPTASETVLDDTARALARAVAARAGTAGRADELERLERRAAELDELTARGASAEAAALRRTLLIELDVLGLLAPGPRHDTAGELRELELQTLSAYHAAAGRLLDYLASGERRAVVAPDDGEGVLGARVSLDWFRLGSDPAPGFGALEWTALGEALLLGASPRRGPEGELYAQWDGRWYGVHWRRDDGNTPALVELRPE